MTVGTVSARLKQAFATVLPDASFEVSTTHSGGVVVKVDAGSHRAAIECAGAGGVWCWYVWQMYPEVKDLARYQQPVDEFDDAAAAAIGVLAGAVALERMAVGAA